ncbi:hypothetical protein [Bythopirellula goksoeyrii]|uniref:Uncharacterized protein n=1 Tax=Bythopirellula goksoeyrii TaxID=1400387 RepID=A0A5B9QKW4_9BACT|nr:hypothetical protein [Bythopirellula goksoeyrii]QEG34771.1 hypothetical protein Pr1d_20550 [Bythopirellula goksoeyrii]
MNSPQPPRPVGRPRVLADPIKRREVCSLIGVGAGYDEAARHVGCTVATIRNEASRDAEFAAQLTSAETTAGLTPLRAMRSAVSTDWRAAAWLLERTCPERYARRKPESLSPSEVRALLDEVASIMADESMDEAHLERMRSRLDELQKARFGQYRSGLQGDPTPKSAEERWYEKWQRELERDLAAVGFDASQNNVSAAEVKTAIAGIEAYDRSSEAEEAEQAQGILFQKLQKSLKEKIP